MSLIKSGRKCSAVITTAQESEQSAALLGGGEAKSLIWSFEQDGVKFTAIATAETTVVQTQDWPSAAAKAVRARGVGKIT